MTAPTGGDDTKAELEQGGLESTVVRGVGLAGAGYLLGQILTLGFYVVLARLATPQDFGEFAAGSVLVFIGVLFTESGMMAAIIHRRDRLDEAASTAVVATAVSGIGLTLAALAAAPLVGLVFHSEVAGEVAAATSAMVLLRSLQVVPEALLQRRFSFLRRLVIQPAGVLAFGIGAVIATANGLGVWGLVIGYYCAAVVDVVLSWGLVGWRPQLRLASFAMWRELTGYGRFVLASVAIMNLGDQIPVVLIGRGVGANALGQYRYAERIAKTPFAFIVQAAAYVIFPALARIAADRERLRSASLKSLRLMCATGFPLALLVIPLGVPAAVIVFGSTWEEAGKAAAFLAGYPIGATLISFASEVVKADGRSDIQARLHVVTVVSCSFFMVVLLPWGLMGVCMGISVGTLAGGSFAVWRVKQLLELGSSRVLAAVLAPTLAGAAMVAFLVPVEIFLVDAHRGNAVIGLSLLASAACAGLAVYSLALRLLAPGTFREFVGALAQLTAIARRPARAEQRRAAEGVELSSSGDRPERL